MLWTNKKSPSKESVKLKLLELTTVKQNTMLAVSQKREARGRDL